MKNTGVKAGVILLIAGLLVGGAEPRAEDQRVRLKGGAEFTAKQLQKIRGSVLVEIDRAEVETVNGKPLPKPVVAGTPAPVFSAVDLTGNSLTVPIPKSPTLIQFWASWCPYCRKDMELMRSVQDEFAPKGLKIISISIDSELEKLTAFLKDNPLAYPVIALQTQGDRAASITEMYEMQGVPSYFLVDAKGVIAQTASGSMTARPEQMVELKKALAGVVNAAGSTAAH